LKSACLINSRDGWLEPGVISPIVFLVFAFLTNVFVIHPAVMVYFSNIATLFLTFTLSAIGLRTNLGAVVNMGLRPFYSAVFILSIVAVVVITAWRFM